jgi:hypothetical protein
VRAFRAEVAKSGGALVVSETYQTAAAARNAGAASANGDWLVFIDADTSPTPALFWDMLLAIRSNRFDAGSCLVRSPGNRKLGIGLWNRIALRRKQLSGGFIFVRAATFRELGGFHPETEKWEELKFGRKLSRARIVILTGNPLLLRPRPSCKKAPVMAEITSGSSAQDWRLALPGERRSYLRRAFNRLRAAGILPPPLERVASRLTTLCADPAQADIDVGQAFTTAIGDLTGTL